MRQIGHFSFRLENLASIGLKVALNPFVIAGLTFYVISVVVWLLVLSRVEVSSAYPMLSVGYIVTALVGTFFLSETLTASGWSGILLICVGVWLLTRAS